MDGDTQPVIPVTLTGMTESSGQHWAVCDRCSARWAGPLRTADLAALTAITMNSSPFAEVACQVRRNLCCVLGATGTAPVQTGLLVVSQDDPRGEPQRPSLSSQIALSALGVAWLPRMFAASVAGTIGAAFRTAAVAAVGGSAVAAMYAGGSGPGIATMTMAATGGLAAIAGAGLAARGLARALYGDESANDPARYRELRDAHGMAHYSPLMMAALRGGNPGAVARGHRAPNAPTAPPLTTQGDSGNVIIAGNKAS